MFRNIVTILTDSVPQTVFRKPYHIPCQKHVPKKVSVHQKSLWNNKNSLWKPETDRADREQEKPSGTPGQRAPAGWPAEQTKKGGSRSRSSTGTPNERMRRRATLPHPLECSTIAVPGLSFRVRKGTGRLTWAMTTAKPIQDGRPENRRPATEPTTIPVVAVREPDNGRKQNALPASS